MENIDNHEDDSTVVSPSIRSGFTPAQLGQCSVSSMTLREHFAGLFLQGLLACPDTDGKIAEFAKDSVNFADALLEELCK